MGVKAGSKTKAKAKAKALTAFILLTALLLEACSPPGTKKAGNDKKSPSKSFDKTEPVSVDRVEKAEKTELNLTEKKDIYDDDRDEASVITMYLTVSRGNRADGSDHTWTEINTYSQDDYDRMGVDRYKVEGLLQIDETGNGIKKGSYGYGETVPNVSVQVRGQTSTRADQKNYKIRIKDGKERFRGQRTLNLNKHRSEPYRFLNKLCYDLMDPIPQLMGARTQFVHLYVKDTTGDGTPKEYPEWEIPPEIVDGYEDCGLFTMVEQINRTYMKSHGMDENGHLYKVTFFEWNKYEEVMVPKDDPSFDRDAFEDYLEIKGDEDPAKLQNVLNMIHNYTIPIDKIVDEHFDAENICYWMAFNILVGNYDVGARNLFIYSPLNSQRFYMICWDMDVAFKSSYNEWAGYSDGVSWECGMTQFLVVTLVNRMMKEEKYRNMLSAAVDDLYRNYVTPDKVNAKVAAYRTEIKPYLYRSPDINHLQLDDMQVYDELTSKLGSEVDRNYRVYKESLKNPWPFYVDMPKANKDTGRLILSWGISYDINEETVTYDYELARDYKFTDVISSGEDLEVPLVTVPLPEAGKYFLKVTATNESGYTTDCFDYYSVDDYGKNYGCYGFVIKPNGETEVASEE